MEELRSHFGQNLINQLNRLASYFLIRVLHVHKGNNDRLSDQVKHSESVRIHLLHKVHTLFVYPVQESQLRSAFQKVMVEIPPVISFQYNGAI